MEKIKNNLGVKAALFVLVIICAVITALSAAIVIINMEYQWYSRTEEAAKADIYHEVAMHADELLLEELYFYNGDSEPVSNEIPLINGEDEVTNFGYKIKLAEDSFRFRFINDGKETDLRVINGAFIESNDVEYHSISEHSEVIIEVFIGEISKGSVPADLYNVYKILDIAHEYGKYAAATALLGMILIIMSVLFFFVSAGRKKEMSKAMASVPIELCLLVAIIVFIILYEFNMAVLRNIKFDIIMLMTVVDAVVVSSIALGCLIVIIIKVKHGNLWKSSITYKICKVCVFIGKKIIFILENLPLVWKTALFVFAGIMINFFIVFQISVNYNGGFWLIWLIGAVIIEGVCIYIALCLRKLKIAGKSLAEGNIEHKIDEKGLFLDFKEHAEYLSSISEGMAKAVEEKMKSERFKTELITNVSHDIKTPLTSIINYVDLIKAEDVDNDNVKEYIDVLDRQSQRLKKLTEDLVEASKAASGTISIDLAPCQIGVLMSQAAGEYKEKMEKENLQLISDITGVNGEILADGRSMWRIFDNIFNNICKYAQPGTRVYQSLKIEGDKVIITYKNTSKYQLNISEDELMERFVRGDRSRHTEGSGLGLSIAKNLAELQGGNLMVKIDGDLFKVILKFSINK